MAGIVVLEPGKVPVAATELQPPHQTGNQTHRHQTGRQIHQPQRVNLKQHVKLLQHANLNQRVRSLQLVKHHHIHTVVEDAVEVIAVEAAVVADLVVVGDVAEEDRESRRTL